MTETIDEKYVITDVKRCARCQDDHDGVVFCRLYNPSDEYEWWAHCPTTWQPILMKIVAEAKEA